MEFKKRRRKRLTKAQEALEDAERQKAADEKYKRELKESKKLIAWIQRLNRRYGI